MSERKIRVGIVGTGFGKSVQISGFRAAPQAEVLAVCASHSEKAQAVQKEFGIPHVLSDYEALLRLKELDLVSIVTPPHLHQPMALAALKAGKHVLCEKPMALHLREARTMYAHAQKSGRVHLIDHELRCNPARQKIQELVAANFIGKLRHAQISLAMSYRAAAESPPWNWWSQKEKGGGILGAVGSHQIDLLRWWFGEIQAVCGDLETFVKQRPLPDSTTMRRVQTDDFCSFWLRFSRGGFAGVSLSAVARHGSSVKIEIYGDEGSLMLTDEKLWAGRTGEALHEITDLTPLPTAPGLPSGVFPQSFVLFAQNLIECLSEGKSPERAATFYDGMRVQAVMDAVRRSARSRRWVKVPRD